MQYLNQIILKSAKHINNYTELSEPIKIKTVHDATRLKAQRLDTHRHIKLLNNV